MSRHHIAIEEVMKQWFIKYFETSLAKLIISSNASCETGGSEASSLESLCLDEYPGCPAWFGALVQNSKTLAV